MWTTCHWVFVPISSSSTDLWSPGSNFKMCLRTLLLLLLRGRVPNKEEILFSSQEGERELLLPAKLELLERQRDWWWWLELDEYLRWLSCEGKKQPPSVVLAALQGLQELRSSNTLAWSLSSVITLLQLLSLERRQPRRPAGELRMAEQSIERWRLLLFKLPENTTKSLSVKVAAGEKFCNRKFVSSFCVHFSGELLHLIYLEFTLQFTS